MVTVLFTKFQHQSIQAPCYINPKMLEDHLGVDLRLNQETKSFCDFKLISLLLGARALRTGATQSKTLTAAR